MSNLDLARGRSTVLNLANQSGSNRSPGDVVVLSTANDESFITSTASNYSSTQLGIVDEAIAVGSNGRVVITGYARQVNVAAAVSRGDFLYQSTTAAKVAGSAIAPPLIGAFGQFLKGGTGTQPSATIYDTQTSGQSSLAVGSNSTDVAGVTAMGTTGKYADAAHWHRGIEKVTSSSSNTLQRPTLNIRSGANVGITASDTDGDGTFDTVTISATAGAGGGSGNWTLITDTLLGSDTASFDFTSIPGTYKHLKIIVSGRSTKAAVTNDFALMRFNNDSGSNYDSIFGQFNSAGWVAATEDVGTTSFAHTLLTPAASSTAGSNMSAEITIPDYASTTLQKAFHCDHHVIMAQSTTNIRRCISGGGWRSTAAITRVTLLFAADNWKTGSRATLYGLS